MVDLTEKEHRLNSIKSELNSTKNQAIMLTISFFMLIDYISFTFLGKDFTNIINNFWSLKDYSALNSKIMLTILYKITTLFGIRYIIKTKYNIIYTKKHLALYALIGVFIWAISSNYLMFGFISCLFASLIHTGLYIKTQDKSKNFEENIFLKLIFISIPIFFKIYILILINTNTKTNIGTFSEEKVIHFFEICLTFAFSLASLVVAYLLGMKELADQKNYKFNINNAEISGFIYRALFFTTVSMSAIIFQEMFEPSKFMIYPYILPILIYFNVYNMYLMILNVLAIMSNKGETTTKNISEGVVELIKKILKNGKE